MSVKTYWHVPEQILYSHFAGMMTLQLLEGYAHTVASLLDGARAGRVHVILDASRVDVSPMMNEAQADPLTCMLRHRRMGYCLMISQSMLVQTMFNRLSRKTVNWQYVHTFSEAVQRIQRVDMGLPIVSSQPPQDRPLSVLR